MDHEQLPLLDRFRWVILLIVGVLILGVFAYLLFTGDEPATITINPPLPTATHTPTGTSSPLEVYVTGAVTFPETRYSLPPDSRVEDAIAAAGGVTGEANLSGVNLAAPLRDGDQVHVPSLVEVELALPTSSVPTLVNINTATQAELETLPGIGPVSAQAIIEYRNVNGPFANIDMLIEVPGIGEATVENLRGSIGVE